LLSSDTISTGDSLLVSVNITNTGKIFGKEVVQLYKQDMVASVSPDIRKLVRFKKIGLEPGETITVAFTIYNHDLAFVGTNNEWITETGEFQVLIGGTPKNLQTKKFYYRQK